MKVKIIYQVTSNTALTSQLGPARRWLAVPFEKIGGKYSATEVLETVTA